MNARTFLNSDRYRKEAMDWLDYPTSLIWKGRLLDLKALDRPLIIQFAGDDPDLLIKAASIVQDDVTAVDLNLGCPQGIARRGNYGAFLLPQQDKVVQILSAMVQGLDCPVTAKIRRLPKLEDTIELCKKMEACGVSMITVHGRLKEQNKQYVGAVDWDVIAQIRSAVNVPVVANGGVGNSDDVNRCFQFTRASGVMSSEAILENPGLFNLEHDKELMGNFALAQLSIVEDYVRLVDIFSQNLVYGPGLSSPAKAHLFKMLYRFLSIPANYDLRDRLGRAKSHSDSGSIFQELKGRVLSKLEKGCVRGEIFQDTTWYDRHRDNGLTPNKETLS